MSSGVWLRYSFSMAMSTILILVAFMTGEPLQIFRLISTYGCFTFVSCNVQHFILLSMFVLLVLNFYCKGF